MKSGHRPRLRYKESGLQAGTLVECMLDANDGVAFANQYSSTHMVTQVALVDAVCRLCGCTLADFENHLSTISEMEMKKCRNLFDIADPPWLS